MQLHLTFSARHVRLPLSHRYALQGMLYHALASNPHYSNYVHNSGYSCGARNYKLFTFGRLSGPFMHSEREIIFKDTVHFEVRSVDPNFVYQLGSVLCPSSQINLFENTLEILDSRIEDYSPNTCCAKISMLSPITVFETERSGYRRFIAPDESLFYTAVVNNALRKWQSYFNTPAPTDFSFEPALPPAELIQNHRIVSRFKRSTIAMFCAATASLSTFFMTQVSVQKTHRDSACLILNPFPTFKHFILSHFLRTAFQPFHAYP